MALTEAAKEILWVKTLLSEIGFKPVNVAHCDLL